MLARFDQLVSDMEKLRKDIKSVAGSALTQARARKK